jgi:hypothetical protein
MGNVREVSDPILTELKPGHVLKLLYNSLTRSNLIPNQLHVLDPILLLILTNPEQPLQLATGEMLIIQVHCVLVLGQNVLEFLFDKVLLHCLVAYLDVLAAEVVIQLEDEELAHEFMPLLLRGGVVDLVDTLALDAHDLLDGLLVRVLAEGLYHDLLALHVDAHSVVWHALGIAIQFPAFFDNFLVLKGSRQQLSTIRTLDLAAGTDPEVAVTALDVLLHEFVVKVVLAAQTTDKWTVVWQVFALAPTSMVCHA